MTNVVAAVSRHACRRGPGQGLDTEMRSSLRPLTPGRRPIQLFGFPSLGSWIQSGSQEVFWPDFERFREVGLESELQVGFSGRRRSLAMSARVWPADVDGLPGGSGGLWGTRCLAKSRRASSERCLTPARLALRLAHSRASAHPSGPPAPTTRPPEGRRSSAATLCLRAVSAHGGGPGLARARSRKEDSLL